MQKNNGNNNDNETDVSFRCSSYEVDANDIKRGHFKGKVLIFRVFYYHATIIKNDRILHSFLYLPMINF